MISKILEKLQTTTKLKLNLLEETQKVFDDCLAICEQLAIDLKVEEPKNIPIKAERINEYEFIFRIGADVLVFILQSNVVRLPDETYLCKSKYLKEDVTLRFFGQILIYNFLADTITYGRLDDPGYLICRILINRERKFFIEGDRKIVYSFPELKENPLSHEKLRTLVELLTEAALDNDLLAPAFQDIMLITYNQKLEHTSSMGNPQKIGFEMFAKNRE
jgi:hypothetical protein